MNCEIIEFNSLDFNKKGEIELLLPGPAGNIEVLIARPENFNQHSPLAVMCHPHPLYGGSMTNKVVSFINKSFLELGALTIRFNFRGVGKSEGEYAEGRGESEDLLFLIQLLRKSCPESECWLAGFSFGAYVAALSVSVAQPDKLLLVAPPVNMYAFNEIPAIDIPWLVIQGAEDEVIDAASVRTWAEQLKSPPAFYWMEGTSHFFHGKLIDLRELILAKWPALGSPV